MKLTELRISNFKCFGEEPVSITFDESRTTIIGPNGSGKTAILQALARMFAINPSLRRIRREDFHVPFNEETTPDERKLFIEADFTLPEAIDGAEDTNTIPPCFNHMRLSEDGESLTIRYRLEATMGVDGDIQENLSYIIGTEEGGSPKMTRVSRAERNHIAVHYIPARRDPNDHIQASTTSLLGRIIRAIDWSEEDEGFEEITDNIKDLITQNSAIGNTNTQITKEWKKLHKGHHFQDANLVFGLESLEKLRNHVSIEFNPAHASSSVDHSFLSDGQKSLLYLSLVTSFIEISRAAMAEPVDGAEDNRIDASELNPPVFSIIAVEEPENSLSPHYLGRINTLLKNISSGSDAQSIVTTHSPSMLQRVEPEKIRHTRLGESRTTSVKEISLPPKADMDAHKYIREGILSNPEVYFSRFVVLGEGASEAIVLPKLFEAAGLPVDENGITIAQLGGRHVNYMWKLLNDLGIPHATLLDLDLCRYHGGWGRIKYAADQLTAIGKYAGIDDTKKLTKWDEGNLLNGEKVENSWLSHMKDNLIFFSQPLDLDFSMIQNYPSAYGIEDDNLEAPDDSTFKSVLGKSHANTDWYDDEETELFESYHTLFKVGSKPAAHISALSKLDSSQLLNDLPEEYRELIECVRAQLDEVHE